MEFDEAEMDICIGKILDLLSFSMPYLVSTLRTPSSNVTQLNKERNKGEMTKMNATIAIIVFIIVYGLILTEKVHGAIAALLGGCCSF